MRSQLETVSKSESGRIRGNPTGLKVLRRVRTSGALLAFGVIAAFAPCAEAGAYVTQAAIDKADSFLGTAAKGKKVLSYVHFGAHYHGHRYVKTLDINDGVGAFGLVYRYWWEDDGITDIDFLCTEKGFVYGVKITDTNAVWSQPFFVANTSISVLGNALIEAYRDKLSESDRRQLHDLVNRADAKGLLEWSLRLDQILK
jgi:hypothetical protein